MTDPAILKECISQIMIVSFSRSSGPGGQNVNKLNTKVTARLNICECDVLSDKEKERIRKKLQNRINEEDEVVLHVQDMRSQAKNREIALQRMLQLITGALKKKKKRVPTKLPPGVKEKRLKLKKKRGELKKQRKRKID